MKVWSVIYGILLILAGFLVLFHPFASMFAIGCVIGIFLLIGGINNIIAAVREKRSGWNIVMGVLTILAAIAILSSYVGGLVALNVLVILMAVILLLQGIAAIMGGVALNKTGASGGLVIFCGVLYIILSILLFSNPITGLFIVEGVVAATLMIEGINQIANMH